MNLSQKIAAALANASHLQSTLVAETASHRLALDLVMASPLGVEANSLQFQSLQTQNAEFTIEQLQAWAARIAARVTYLMEPLRVVEADANGVEVEIRSQAPTPRDGQRGYFEARLNRQGLLRILRFAFSEASRTRQSVSFQLTREVLERLTDDLVATCN